MYALAILVVLAILPVFLILKIVNGKDIDQEPKELRKNIFTWGCISIVPVILVEQILDRYFSTNNITDFSVVLLFTFLGVGLVEEVGKFISAYHFTKDSPEFDHRYDAIVYCVYASLGFAAVENILYVLSFGLITAIMRGLLAVPSHACDAIMMGYFYGLYKEEKFKGNKSKSVLYLVLAILIPSIEHAIYDGALILMENQEKATGDFDGNLLLLVLGLTIVCYIICFLIIKKVSKIDTNFDNSKVIDRNVNVFDNTNRVTSANSINNVNTNTDVNKTIRYCTNCGAPIADNYCAYCGNKKV